MDSNDIVPQLLEKIKKEFEQAYRRNKNIANMLESGIVTYEDANRYAYEVGNIFSEVMHKNITPEILPNGRMYYNIADRVIRKPMEDNYNLISYVVQSVQEELNRQAGLGIKAQVPPLPMERINNLVNKAVNVLKYADVRNAVETSFQNYSQSIVDDSIKLNSEFHYKAGLKPTIVRKTNGKCCKWCTGLAGTYSYPDEVPRDVWRRHRNCDCIIEYFPIDGKKKTEYNYNKQGKNKKNSELRIENAKKKTTDGMAPDAVKKRIDMSEKLAAAEKITPEERNVRANFQYSSEEHARDESLKQFQLGYIDYKYAERMISFFNDQIRNLEIENAITIEKSGRVTRFIGTLDEVPEIEKMIEWDGLYTTHNHPSLNLIASFGEEDYSLLTSHQDIAKMYCCNKEYDYSLEIIKPLDLSYTTVYDLGTDKYTAGMMLDLSEEEIERIDLQHDAMLALVERGYIKYERTPIR